MSRYGLRRARRSGRLISASFVKLLLWQRRHFLRAPASMQWFLPAAGGLTVGLLGWFFPEVLGVGYSYVGMALNGQMVVSAMALLVILKIIATATCYASGNAGGIFGPSLFIGAAMGGTLGGIAHMLIPDYTGSSGAYALVGMGAAFAGIVRVPLTSVIMVFEITRDYSIIVPLMIANLISYYISSKLQKKPIYEALLHQDGLHLPSGARARESLIMVGHAYRPEAQVLSASERIHQAAASVDRKREAWPVVDEGGFRGMVTLEELDAAIASGRGDSTVAELVPAPRRIEELTETSFPRVYANDPLHAAIQWLADGRVKVLPVLSRTNARELKGTISLQDVLSAYAVARSQPEAAESKPGLAAKAPSPLLAGVLAACAGLAVLGGVLNYHYRVQRSNRAMAAFNSGNELLQKDRLPEAIEQYRYALSISHDVDHRLALGLALVKADRLNEAPIYLNEVLRDRPDSGPANLAMATIAVKTGRADDALTYYRRAIAGSWSGEPAQNKIQARLQLVQFLASSGKPAQARAELLSMAADLPRDPSSQMQVGRKLLEFGMPREAADLFKGMLKEGPPNAAEYDGLGEAEFLLGEYRAAKDAYRRALAIDPGDKTAAHRVEVSDTILALDPAQRGIGSRERYRRSQEILKLVLAGLLDCAGSVDVLSEPSRDQVAAARTELARKKAPAALHDAADANLALAEALWSARAAICRPAPADDALTRIMSSLAR